MFSRRTSKRSPPRTKSGEYMKFLTLEDRTDTYEAILFHEAYQRYGQLTLSYGPYLAQGVVREEDSYNTLHVERLWLLR